MEALLAATTEEKGKASLISRAQLSHLEDQLATAHTRITNLLAGDDVPPLAAADPSKVLHSHVKTKEKRKK